MKRQDIDVERIGLAHMEGDYTVLAELLHVDPASFDNVVLMASDRLDTGEEADARTIMGGLLLTEVFAGAESRPRVLVELMDPENLQLFARRQEEILVSPVVLSHMLAQVTLRRELRAVFDELFGPGGAEVFFRPAADCGLVGDEVRSSRLQEAATELGGDRPRVADRRRAGQPRRRRLPEPGPRADLGAEAHRRTGGARHLWIARPPCWPVCAARWCRPKRLLRERPERW